MGFFDIFSDTIGVDPGSKNLRIVKKGKLIFNEPTVVSLNKKDLKNLKLSGLGNSIVDKDLVLSPVNYSINDFLHSKPCLEMP